MPNERIAVVRPFWETVTKEERAKLLTLEVDDLRERAAMLTDRYQKQAGACPAASVFLLRRCTPTVLSWPAASCRLCWALPLLCPPVLPVRLILTFVCL